MLQFAPSARIAATTSKFSPTDRAFHPELRDAYTEMQERATLLMERLLADNVALCRVPVSRALAACVYGVTDPDECSFLDTTQ